MASYFRKRPTTIKAFMRPPNQYEWAAELDSGWKGSDGSSQSLDSIGGIRIGITSKGFMYSRLPANFHDWLYQQGRRHKLGWRFRKAADKAYRDMCLESVSVLISWPGWKARRRCEIRYVALRLFGGRAWKG